ncbi:hypothetical protein WJX72_006367 [[Myrmecia] bisecta]|uniref:Phosphodiesterase n=1 Tax=[Myrmecia] bisecta TaxID=41462 RepID=A0AAW1QFA3_9CHLO
MEPINSQALGRDTVGTCLGFLRQCKDDPAVSAAERYALGVLVNWLAQVDLCQDTEGDELDESARAYLLSYRDKFTRKNLIPRGHGELVGDSPKSSHSATASNIHDPVLAAEMDKLDDWDTFDIFKVAELSKGRPLVTVVMALLRRYDLLDKLTLPLAKTRSFFREIEAAYRHNPYHNSLHAADVTQSLGCMFACDEFTSQLTDLEMLSMIIATSVHDVGHPGVTNEFLINTNSDIAVTYNDNSINENMHAALAFRILRKPENNCLAHLPEEQFRFVRRTVVRIVLSTDMAGHAELVKDFAANVKLLGPNLLHWSPEKRSTVLSFCVHCADIANPAKPLHLGQQWTDRVMQEFFSQGDKERERGLPVSPLCDREKVQVPKSQMTFLDYVVKPSYEALKWLAPHTAERALHNIERAKQHWASVTRASGQSLSPQQSLDDSLADGKPEAEQNGLH